MPSSESPVTIVCPLCGHSGTRGPGPGGRPDASCRQCGSLERHRGLAGILNGVTGHVAHGTLADIAPTPLMSQLLGDMARDAGVPYVGLDFDPGADNRVVTVQASLTDMPLADASVGLMICFHVLEHIPDDHRAMRDIARVLAPGGVALVQVPWRPGTETDEDPSASVEERLRRFGQADHVRYYGSDVDARLVGSGLSVRRITMSEVYDEHECVVLGIVPGDPVWLCTSSGEVDLDAVRAECKAFASRAVLDALAVSADERDAAVEAATKAKAKVKQLRRQRDRAASSELQLRRRPDVRVVSAVARRTRRLRRSTKKA